MIVQTIIGIATAFYVVRMDESTDPREYYRLKYQTLEDLPTVGPSTAQKLGQIGFKTVQMIATASTRELIEAGIGEATANRIIEAARKSIEVRFITAHEYAKIQTEKRKITTGCDTLDRLLEGGIETHSITEFYGEFGSGKSQICQQLAVSVQLPVDEGGLDAACLYIDSEEVFTGERVTQMAEYLGMDPEKALKGIIYADAYTSEHQTSLLDHCDEVVKEQGIRLIIIDSLTAHFRSEYPGRELLAPRQQKLNVHLHKLKRLCRSFNAAAVVTNQVMAHPDSSHGGPQHPRAVGGHILGHAAHTRVFLRKGRSNLRIAKIIASPFLPEGETPFRITGRGIEGDEEI